MRASWWNGYFVWFKFAPKKLDKTILLTGSVLNTLNKNVLKIQENKFCIYWFYCDVTLLLSQLQKKIYISPVLFCKTTMDYLFYLH